MAAAPVFFQNVAGRLLLDAEGFLRIQWSAQPRRLSDTQALFEQVLSGLQSQGWGRVLTNQTAMSAFSPEEQRWLSEQWLPRAVAAGYRYGAVVVATDTFARLSTAFITTNVGELTLRYRSFDEEAPAIAWLRQQG